MNKGVILVLAVLVLVFFTVYRLVNLRQSGYFENKQEKIELNDDLAYVFVGEGCGGCEQVLSEIDRRNLDDDLAIEVLEVFNNTENQKFYREAFNRCGKEMNGQISVPVLYYGGQCFDGGKDEIINKLEEVKTGGKNK
ncbi:MAG: hypothetical protein ABIC19_04070 [Patescibacteria group bacterium]|nr:hypothetical protein [Patescibacteria group bacterium]